MTAGWLLIGGFLLVAASVIGLFPKSLPRAAARRVLAAERRSAGLSSKDDENKIDDDIPTSFAGTLFSNRWVSGDLDMIVESMGAAWYYSVAPSVEGLRDQSLQMFIILLKRGQSSEPNFRCRSTYLQTREW